MAGPVNNHNQRHIWNEEEEHQLLLARATFPHRRDWIRIRQDPRFNGLFGQMTVDALRVSGFSINVHFTVMIRLASIFVSF